FLLPDSLPACTRGDPSATEVDRLEPDHAVPGRSRARQAEMVRPEKRLTSARFVRLTIVGETVAHSPGRSTGHHRIGPYGSPGKDDRLHRTPGAYVQAVGDRGISFETLSDTWGGRYNDERPSPDDRSVAVMLGRGRRARGAVPVPARRRPSSD